MKLNSESVNITPKNLITNAVRCLVEAEGADDYDWASSLSEIAQGYLKAAELMTESHQEYLDLVPRPEYSR